jgi:uncharacterized protein (UPF0218 family)
MAVTYRATPQLRVKLKQPFGLLIRGTFSETMNQLILMVEREKPPMIVAVGDTVSQNLYKHGVKAQLLITDNKRKRKRSEQAVFPTKRIVRVKNPQGTITEEAIAAVQDALKSGEQVHIVVNGEEDLLALVAVWHAQDGSLVVYGQPGEGIVVVKVTPEKKAEALEIWKVMETVRKAK